MVISKRARRIIGGLGLVVLLGLLAWGGSVDNARVLSVEAGLRDLRLRVLLKMELAVLPFDAGEHRLACGRKSNGGVADDELYAADPAFDEVAEDIAPVYLGRELRYLWYNLSRSAPRRAYVVNPYAS